MKCGAVLMAGIVVGVVVLGGARFAMVDFDTSTHYHANWALFIDGERVDLSGDRYMEDVAACSADPDQMRPEDRVHMHDGNQDVVHVHHQGATWGHFMTNIGFALGEDWLRTDDGRYLSGDSTATLKFVLNGIPQAPIHDRIIRSEDRLLISYGPASLGEIQTSQWEVVASDAGEFNAKSDPAGCMGHGEPSFGEKLRKAFWN